MTKSATPPGVLDSSTTKGSKTAPRADWESIEKHYRSGALSVRSIAVLEAVSESAIRKKAKERGWTRDLTERVQQKVREKLIAEEVGEAELAQRAEQRAHRPDPTADAEIVESASDTVVRVVREHRGTIRRSRELLETMLGQLQEAVEEREVIEQEIEQATEDDESTKRRNRYLRAVSLPAQVVALRDLSLTLRNLVALEREAFNIGDAPPPPVSELTPIEQARVGFEDLRAAFQKRLALSGTFTMNVERATTQG